MSDGTRFWSGRGNRWDKLVLRELDPKTGTTSQPSWPAFVREVSEKDDGLRSDARRRGYAVDKPSAILSTAEAVGVASSLGLAAAFLPSDRELLRLVPGYLAGVVTKDDPKDQARLLAYWDGVVERRADAEQRVWRTLYELRGLLET